MRIFVDSSGLFTTIQDPGRPGYGIEGVSRAGAADPLALRIGNRLLGNDDGAPALEMTLLGGTFTFPEGGHIALTGARPSGLPHWQPIQVSAAETIRIGALASGARCYLCVRGGLAVPRVAGSASTHVLSGLGGRPLRKGDVLPIGAATAGIAFLSFPPELTTYRKVLRVTRGPQSSRFDEELFYNSQYTVSAASNRMGLRLEGTPVPSADRGEMITEGVPLGAIQIPAGGQPIILFVDHQTTGGYPKIANVVTADLPSVGQLCPGDAVVFQLVTNEAAQQLLRRQEALLSRI